MASLVQLAFPTQGTCDAIASPDEACAPGGFAASAGIYKPSSQARPDGVHMVQIARNHAMVGPMRRRPALAAGFAVALLVVGQLAALKHEAESRHVTCEQHGEQLEAPSLSGALDNCGQSHWIGVEGIGGEHQDCAITRSLRQSSDAPGPTPTCDVIAIIAATAAPPPAALARTFDVILIAPKTSPPA